MNTEVDGDRVYRVSNEQRLQPKDQLGGDAEGTKRDERYCLMGVGPIEDVEVGYFEAAAFDTCMLENSGGKVLTAWVVLPNRLFLQIKFVSKLPCSASKVLLDLSEVAGDKASL